MPKIYVYEFTLPEDAQQGLADELTRLKIAGKDFLYAPFQPHRFVEVMMEGAANGDLFGCTTDLGALLQEVEHLRAGSMSGRELGTFAVYRADALEPVSTGDEQKIRPYRFRDPEHKLSALAAAVKVWL